MDDLEFNPVGDTSADKEREARRFYNSVFREVPFWLKASYRGPLLILIIVIALIVTIGLPLLAGWLTWLMFQAFTKSDAVVLLRAFGLWVAGVAAIGAIGISVVVAISFWSATLDAIKRTLGLLRGE